MYALFVFAVIFFSNAQNVYAFTPRTPASIKFLCSGSMLGSSSSAENVVVQLTEETDTKEMVTSSLLPQSQQETIQVVNTNQHNTMTNFDCVRVQPPPLATSNPNDDFFREIRQSWPLWVQNTLFRDSGLIRFIMDNVLTKLVGIPTLLQKHPHLLLKFLHKSSFTKCISYGSHPLQTIDLISLRSKERDKTEKTEMDLVVLVHGGAWGSGRPWMYRLAALPFLNQNTDVAVIGYRTYPDGNAMDQVEDLEMAVSKLSTKAYKHVSVMGHSTGAHISILMILKRLQQQKKELVKKSLKSPIQESSEMNKLNSKSFNPKRNNDDLYDQSMEQNIIHGIGIDAFIALSGPYCIQSHYEYEQGRGLDAISPLTPACGHTYDNFAKVSPATLWKQLTSSNSDDNHLIQKLTIPKMAFVHGLEDDTVPYTSTTKLVNELTNSSKTYSQIPFCQGFLLQNVGHADTILHFILGGPTEYIVLRWLTENKTQNNQH